MIGTPALGAVLQCVQHARAVDAGIVADKDDAIGALEIRQRHRADRNADAEGQADRRALVAHVGAVGQIVVAVEAREQRVHVGCFERSAARAVEHDVLRIEAS